MAPGQRFTMRDAGGGGFGDPANRPRAKVLADLEEGLITAGTAREVYGLGAEDAANARRAADGVP